MGGLVIHELRVVFELFSIERDGWASCTCGVPRRDFTIEELQAADLGIPGLGERFDKSGPPAAEIPAWQAFVHGGPLNG